MFKVKCGISCPFFSDLFEFKNMTTRYGCIFNRPKANTVNSLQVFGPIVWNDMLPDSHKICANLDDLKQSIKSWILLSCPCNLCKEFIPGVDFTF